MKYCCKEFEYKFNDGFISKTEYYHIHVYTIKDCNSCEREHRIYSGWILDYCPFCGKELSSQ